MAKLSGPRMVDQPKVNANPSTNQARRNRYKPPEGKAEVYLVKSNE